MSGYIERIRAAVIAGTLPAEPGHVTSVEVEHGPGCRKSPCTCHPRITAVAGDQVVVIGSGGAVLERSKRQ